MDDRIVLPNEIEEITVDYSANGLFERNSSVTWPVARSTSGISVDLGKVGKKDGMTAHKLFARMDKSGWGALYREKIGQGLVVRFDPLFFHSWVCGFAQEPGQRLESRKQYTVALEPTTSNTDSLASAGRNGTVRCLNGREHCRWRLKVQLVGASGFSISRIFARAHVSIRWHPD